jgi:serine/threonine protein kinase/predicted Zn-dependent protease
MRKTMADPARPASDSAGAVPPPEAADRPRASPPSASSASHASVLEVVARISGEVQKLLLRDSPSEDGGSPILDTSSPDFRTIRQLSSGRGDYELLGEIARGGMGVILKGHDRDIGRDVAVKVLRQELAKRPEALQRFVEEAQIGGQLQHPGIVPVYEMGLLADERPYFTMKLVKGRTLSALLTERAGAAAERPRFLAIFEQVCQTMAYAHSKGVVHRDLKPANVMVGAFGEVQVLDWGLAKVLAQGGVADEKRERQRDSQASVIATIRNRPGSPGSHSLAGSVMGTPTYMPPEQARGEIDRLDERSDVFALGAILCEILTGKPPYAGEPEEVMSRAANAELADATQRLEECEADAELVALAKRCLAPAPSARPRHAGLLAKEVAAWRDSLDQRARAAEIAAAAAGVRADEERRRRRLTLLLAVSVVVILALGAGGWNVYSSKRVALQEQRLKYESQTEASVNEALAQAALFRGRKEWSAAAAAMQEARALVDAGQPTGDLRRRVRDQGDAIAKESDEAKRRDEVDAQNRELVAHLKRLRRPESRDQEKTEELDAAYSDAFSAYGLPLENWSAEEAARALQSRCIAEPAAQALDDWADARRRLKHGDDAERLVEIALKADPDPVRSRLRRAIQIGDRSLLREFTRDEDLAQLPASSLNLLATAFRKAAADGEALRVLKIAQASHPEDYVVNFNLGLAWRALLPPRMEDAVRCFQAALAAEPGDQRLQALIGFEFVADLGDASHGLALLERSERADPADPEIRRLHGRACDLLNDFEGAIAAFRERVRLLPNDPQAHSDLGDVLDWNGDATAAIPCYRESLRLDPKNEDTYSSLAYALIDAGDIDGARAQWEIAKGRGNQQLSTLWLAADFAALEGDRFSARRAIDAVIARTSTNGVVPLRVAVESLVAFRDPELRGGAAAVTAARRMVELEPRAGRAWSSLGAALHSVGDAEGCIAAEERAMPLLAGGCPIEWLPLALALEQSGHHESALEWKRQALEWMERHHARPPYLLILRDEAKAKIRE